MSAIRSPAPPVRSRIYEKIIWETARERRCSSFAELLEEVKCRCARFRIPYHHGEINDALNVMGDKVRNELLPPLERPHAGEPPPGPPSMTHEEACHWLGRVRGAPRPMPTVKAITPFEADRRAAQRVVAEAIVDSVTRCEDLERER